MATTPKRTPWFQADVKPVREGLYEVKSGRETRMALYEGERWWSVDENDARGEELGAVKQWRGLAAEPKAPEAPPRQEAPTERLEDEAAETQETEEEMTDEDVGNSGLPL